MKRYGVPSALIYGQVCIGERKPSDGNCEYYTVFDTYADAAAYALEYNGHVIVEIENVAQVVRDARVVKL